MKYNMTVSYSKISIKQSLSSMKTENLLRVYKLFAKA